MKKKPEGGDTDISVTVRKTQARYAVPLEYKIVEDRKINLTRDKAFEFLEQKTFEGERAVRDQHVQYLYDEFIAGRFMWHQTSIASAVLNGETFRVNGQHTCWMRVNISEAHEPVKADVRQLIYEVKDIEQLKALYSTFDRGAPRTVGHVSTVMLLGTEAAAGIAPSYIKTLLAGYRLFESEDWRKTKRPTELVESIKQKHSAVFNTVGQFLSEVYDHDIFIRRAGVIGAIFATFVKSVKDGTEFWKPVCTGLGLEKLTDPRYRLREFLSMHGQSTVKRARQSVSAEATYRIGIHCWNNWRDNVPIKSIKTPDTSLKRPTVKA